ncbi:hypothetical protein NB311A_11917 [Nitrobacter sp. Nb-311A]|uniref:hypothetical protein n=1 Tax=Nitrobacter sp. Nb-311A TaxID=314253 RepID=UPI0000685323|nr:hypothetical protein [Nitrobacter sp. Nb-311A]EAQ34447.1 hypothetical protein NB311A_11917 [Nitrobacter sp. Nb-311A]
MRNVIPFPQREPAAPQPERLELFDDIDASTGKPIFGLFVRMADGSWVDGEFYDSAAERDAAIPSWRADWSIDVVEIFWKRKPA